MRKILKDTCIFAALMILIIFTFSIATAGMTAEIKLVLEIFGLAFALSVFNYFFDEKTSFPMLASYLIKYVAVSIFVIAFGFIVGWFFPSNYWMAFIYVGVITVIVYALDSVKTEKDVEEINEMVRRSNNEKIEVSPLSKRHGLKVLVLLLMTMVLLFGVSLTGFYTFGRPDFTDYCMNGMLIFAAASAVLSALLLAYLIVFKIKQKKT